MRLVSVFCCAVLAILTFSGAANAAPVLLTEIPAYDWYHGCGPTAAASVLGYWELHGYTNMFTANDPDVYLTANVQDQISSPAHNTKYDPTPDAGGPVPAFTSIADWFQTSVDPLEFGWSYLSDSDNAFTGYAGYRGYTFNSWFEGYVTAGAPGFTWADLVAEIGAGRPIMFLVDTDGNGGTDHFIPVFGYDDRGQGGLWYACYTTWHEAETVDWYQFRGMGNDWGVGYATFCVPVGGTVPEPAALMSLVTGLALLGGYRLRRKA